MDDLLHYYNNELEFLNKEARYFAQRHPQVASNLGINEGRIEDPHISRLLEGVAFLTARIKANLDDDVPQFTDSLMEYLYPDFRSPIPSQTIIQAKSNDNITEPLTIHSGAEFFVKDNENTCVFRIRDTIRILPLQLHNIRWQSVPVKAPKIDKEYKAVLSLDIIPEKMVDTSIIDDESLRFYIKSQGQTGIKLHEALLKECSGIAIQFHHTNEVHYLSPECLQQYGFTPNEYSKIQDERTSCSHQQLTDFFCFYQQFMFFELHGLINNQRRFNCWNQAKEGFRLFIYSKVDNEILSNHIDDSSIALGCVSAINIFEEKMQTISVDTIGHEIKIEPKSFYSKNVDVHKILSLNMTNQFGEESQILPYYSVHSDETMPFMSNLSEKLYWTIRKEPRVNTYDDHENINAGINTYLSIVDDRYSVIGSKKGFHINGRLLCTNQNIPSQLEYSALNPIVEFMPSSRGVVFKAIEKPTPWRLRSTKKSSRWQFVNCLSLQSFTDSSENGVTDGLNVLKDILRLYSPMDPILNKLSEKYIKGLVKLELKPKTEFIQQSGMMSLCRGTEINLTCDEYYWDNDRVFLFSTLMNHFFASLASVNTFTQLNIFNQQETEAIIKWKPMTGYQTLL